MASFYSSLSGEGDMLPTAYFQNQKLDAYLSSELPNNKLYENEPSVSLSYPNFLSGGSLSAHDHVQPESIGSRDESMFIPPTRVSGGMQQIDRRLNINPHYSDGNTVTESIPQYHGLSLSLGSQEGSLVQLSSDLNQFTNSSFGSMLSSDMQSEVHLSGNNGIKNVQYLSFDLAGKAQDTVKYGDVNNFQNMISSKEMSFMPPLHHAPELGGTFCNSTYLKAAQELLNEVVNVHRDIQKSGKGQNFNSVGRDGFMGTDVKRDGMSAEPQESAANELSPSERHDLQNKMTKLLSMLDEVDSRYKQYFHQMQAVVSSFDMVAGRGAAQPYTALALRTISIQFRCLRDAIKKQIQATQKSLGDQDTNSQGQGVLSRLRFVDQQLRQQKSLHQFGIMRQPWRPQRGLPETAVSVLRAWLFEHFLHPYPKDSEKLVLARQTGLSRGQVANWFINARVRLWKPMIEEMYKEEFGVAGTETKSSPEIPTANQEFSSFEERENDFHGSLFSAEAEDDGSNFMAGRHDDLMGNSTGGNQVSLALGLQQSERDSQQIGSGLQPKGKNASSSSMGLDKLEYYYVDPVNNQQRFGNRHMLSDFVA